MIKNRIIWIKGLNGEAAYKWLQFCRGFSPKCASDGLFVLELPAKISVLESKFIQCIDFDNCVSSYDVQQFNSFILDDQKDYTPDWRRYISAAAAAVCGVDSELSEMLLKVVDYRVETAIDGLQRIDEMPFIPKAAPGRLHPSNTAARWTGNPTVPTAAGQIIST